MTKDSLAYLMSLGEDLVRAKAGVEAAEAVLKEKKARVNELESDVLPDVMEEIGVTEFTLTGGAKISVSSQVAVSITAAKKEMAHRWLVENGHGDLIKAVVSVGLAMDEPELRKSLLDTLDKMDLDPEVKEAVHAGSLKSWARGMRESGKPFPADLFSAYDYRLVKFTAPKK